MFGEKDPLCLLHIILAKMFIQTEIPLNSTRGTCFQEDFDRSYCSSNINFQCFRPVTFKLVLEILGLKLSLHQNVDFCENQGCFSSSIPMEIERLSSVEIAARSLTVCSCVTFLTISPW